MSEPRRSPERAHLLSAVERVRDIVQAHAEDAELRRTLSPAVVDALHSSGLFAMSAPRALGGAECDPLTQIEVFEAMTRIDTSAGWSLMISAMIAALMGAYLPDAGAARVFTGAFPICAGFQQPVGTARRAPGGYVLHGRWPFGSGVCHASWTFTGATVEPEEPPAAGEPPETISVAVPSSSVQIEDTWDAAGLRGSGSHHYRMEGVFVPEELTCPWPGPAPRRGGAVFTLPLFALLSAAHIGFALGCGRRALDEIALLAPRRKKLWTGVMLGEHAAFHMDLGRAEAKLAAARAYGVEVIGAMWDRARAGEPLSIDEGASVRLVTVYAINIAAEVVSFAFHAGGGGALYASSPLQRYFRDIHAANQHIAATDDAYEFAGRVRLGQIAESYPMLAPRAPREA